MNLDNTAFDTDEIGLILIAFAISGMNLTTSNLDNVVKVTEEEAVDTAALIASGVIEQAPAGWVICDALKSSVTELRARYVASVVEREWAGVGKFAEARDFWISWEWNNYIEG